MDARPGGEAKKSASSMWWYTVEGEAGSMNEEFYQPNVEVFCSVCQVPLAEAQGPIYTRWGHIDCPANSRTVYRGIAASERRDSQGGGANNVCLTEQSSRKTKGFSTGNEDRGRLYGVEYKHAGLDEYDFGQFDDHQDAGCAVCQV